MSEVLSMMAHRFDLAALDVLLGSQGFISAIDRDDATGRLRYASIHRDSFDDGAMLRITANYVLGFANRGRRLFPLLALDIEVYDGVATIVCARKLGRLAKAEPLANALMSLAKKLALKQLPTRDSLNAFLPTPLLNALESDTPSSDFPAMGVDQEERLPQALWEQPCVLREGKVDRHALAVSLNLAIGERVEKVMVDPITGDYRVFHLSLQETSQGDASLVFELIRQGPGFEEIIFTVLSLILKPPGAEGLCEVKIFTCDTGVGVNDFSFLLPVLAQIIAALQKRQRPDDALLLPLLSQPAQKLWTKHLKEGAAA